jgi:hypothetical protein
MTWRVADSCPCSTAHNKRSLLYPYGNIQHTGPVWREARSVPYGHCLGERFHKSGTVTLYYIPRQYYEILEWAPEGEYISYTLLKNDTSKLIIFFLLTENENVKALQKFNLPAVDRGKVTPLLKVRCISEGHSSIFRSSGAVSIRPCSVRSWGPRPTVQWVVGTSRRTLRPRELHHSPPSGAAFTNARTLHPLSHSSAWCRNW